MQQRNHHSNVLKNSPKAGTEIIPIFWFVPTAYKETPEEYIKLFYNELLPPTSQHESSMLQDLRAGKRTEIDGLQGAVIKLAGKYNLSVPYNKILYKLIKSME